MNGKGSKRRPSQIDKKELKRRWELMFGKLIFRENSQQKERENRRHKRNEGRGNEEKS